MLFSLLRHYLDLHKADTFFTLKVSQCLYCFTSSASQGVENYFPGLWGTGISGAIFPFCNHNVGPTSQTVIALAQRFDVYCRMMLN